jgi:eukaryotic-like serine/threonine-protein kinase
MRNLSYDNGPAWAGSVLLADTYLLGRLIGRGGMSETFEATHARLPGRFAVKILAPELAGNREAFARFCREAEVMSELRHPNMVQIFDFNTAPDERPYFVMEYLEGRDLQTRLDESEPPTLPATVRVVEAVASALGAAHAHGIVHRDLKPANIFLVAVDGQPDELVKVLDFGIASMRKAGTLAAAPTEILGVPPYISPEQVQGVTDQIDGRTDQFALAAIAYRMLTGHDAFVGPDLGSVVHQIVHDAPPPLAHDLPTSWDTRPLQAVLDRALAKDPAERWGGMMEFARAFEAAAEGLPSAPALPVLPVARAASIEAPRSALAIEPVGEELAPPAVRPRESLASSESTKPTVMPLAIARSRPEPAAIAAVPRPTRPAAETDGADRDLEEEEPLDWVPVTHHRGAVLGTVALALAGTLIGTGWYRKIPGALPRVRQTLATWLQPKPVALPQPAVTPPEATRSSPTIVATQGAAPPVQPASPPGQADPSAAAPGASATAAPPAEAPTAGATPMPASPPPVEALADAPAPAATAVPHHHHAATVGSRFRGHPGSIELSPVPAADSAAPPTPAPNGFPIEPPPPLSDLPARDLAPAREPPTSPPAPSPSADAPMAPFAP